MQFRGFFCAGCNTFFNIDFDKEDAIDIERIIASQATGQTNCPTCKKSPIYPTCSIPGAERIHDVTAAQLWNAVNAMGLPGEEASKKVVKHLLESRRVESTSIKESTGNDTRCIVESITLIGGKVLHFTSSGEGACVYKVTEEQDAW